MFSFGVLAQTTDFSFYDNTQSFLAGEKIVAVEDNQNLKSDFIFPLVFDQEKIIEERNLDKNVVKKSKSSWNYVVKKGENLWSISRKFKVPLSDLLALNGLNEKSIIKAGDKILISGVQPQATFDVQPLKKFMGKFVNALSQAGDFVIPVSGFNWGQKHSNNGTDIAAECGQEVFAAHSGIVVESANGWNSGYGNYIIISHRNGVYSLYGHLSLRIVEKGDEVEKGELIGYVGNSGHTLGPTGCHLHFEVRGTTNPLLK